jgi:hypothetical protein
MIFAAPSALCDWPAMNSRATDDAIGSLPFHREGVWTSLMVPMLRIFSRVAGQFNNPTASIAATPIGLLAHTPPSTSSIDSLVRWGLRNVGAAAVAIAASSAGSL